MLKGVMNANPANNVTPKKTSHKAAKIIAGTVATAAVVAGGLAIGAKNGKLMKGSFRLYNTALDIKMINPKSTIIKKASNLIMKGSNALEKMDRLGEKILDIKIPKKISAALVAGDMNLGMMKSNASEFISKNISTPIKRGLNSAKDFVAGLAKHIGK